MTTKPKPAHILDIDRDSVEDAPEIASAKDAEDSPIVYEKTDKIKLPDYSCPLIDDAQAFLRDGANQFEQVRTRNEELRDAAKRYYAENARLVNRCNKLLSDMANLAKVNKSLLLKREYLEQVAIGAIAIDRAEFITLQEYLLKIKDLEFLADELIAVVKDLGYVARVKRTLSVTAYTMFTERVSAIQQKNKDIRDAALAKLTDEEKKLLRLSVSFAKDGHEDDDDKED